MTWVGTRVTASAALHMQNDIAYFVILGYVCITIYLDGMGFSCYGSDHLQVTSIEHKGDRHSTPSTDTEI